MWPSSTWIPGRAKLCATGFNRSSAMWPSSTRPSIACSILRLSFNRSSAMWPSSTARKRLETVQPRLMFQSLKRDVAFFHIIFAGHMVALIIVSIAQARCGLLPLWLDCPCRASRQSFQSLKRDVAFFHMKISRSCFVLVMFQSLKRDVAFFHYGSYHVLKYFFDVSIAQARCGLLPPHSFYPLFMLFLKFQSLKRDVAFFHKSRTYTRRIKK